MKSYRRFSSSMVICGIACFMLVQACGSKSDSKSEYYGADDFVKVKKTDVHAHIYTADMGLYEQAEKDNVSLISINVEVPGEPPIDSQQYFALRQQQQSGGRVRWLATIGTTMINEPGWAEKELTRLKNSFDSGAIGIKVWKSIGMTVRDKKGNFIMIDDPVFDPIFDYLEQNNIPVLGHIGEPKNCWLPLEQMTTNNDRNYFREHPEYHMFLHPEYPAYDTIIKHRDNLLEKHPKLKFIGAHLASLEWDVDEIARRLDKYPNMGVETAERFGQLQYQSVANYDKVRNFFIKYQDRIMYGTDLVLFENDNRDTIQQKARALWLRDWKYFTTGDSLQSPQVNSRFKGLQLPKEVVDKVYYANADKWFGKK
jgi:predicted TIM-barrel fold metal-dependent hydrolase